MKLFAVILLASLVATITADDDDDDDSFELDSGEVITPAISPVSMFAAITPVSNIPSTFSDISVASSPGIYTRYFPFEPQVTSFNDYGLVNYFDHHYEDPLPMVYSSSVRDRYRQPVRAVGTNRYTPQRKPFTQRVDGQPSHLSQSYIQQKLYLKKQQLQNEQQLLIRKQQQLINLQLQHNQRQQQQLAKNQQQLTDSYLGIHRVPTTGQQFVPTGQIPFKPANKVPGIQVQPQQVPNHFVGTGQDLSHITPVSQTGTGIQVQGVPVQTASGQGLHLQGVQNVHSQFIRGQQQLNPGQQQAIGLGHRQTHQQSYPGQQQAIGFNQQQQYNPAQQQQSGFAHQQHQQYNPQAPQQQTGFGQQQHKQVSNHQFYNVDGDKIDDTETEDRFVEEILY